MTSPDIAPTVGPALIRGLPELVSLPQTIAALGFPSLRFLHREVAAGRLRTIHVGRRTFVPRVEAERYMRELLEAQGLSDLVPVAS